MSKSFVLLFMIFCHILDDFVLQTNSPLANMKQKLWWENNASHPIYKYDYILALIIHSLSWAFMIMLPIAIYYKFIINSQFILFFIINVVLHAIVDDEKANQLSINLWFDQIIHMGQILLTFLALIL